MHYIRLLRPPALVAASGATKPDSLPVLSLVLTITTDLGDAFLCPEEPLGLVVELAVEVEEEEEEEEEEDVEDEGEEEDEDGEKEDEEEGDDQPETKPERPRPTPPPQKTLLFRLPTTTLANDKKKNKPPSAPAPAPGGGEPAWWSAGMRVLKLEAALPDAAAAVWRSDDVKRFCIRAAQDAVSATHARQIINPDGRGGLVLPLWIDVPDDAIHSDEPFPHVALRRLGISPAAVVEVEVEEEIGESIARHVWDAGLVTVAFLADACLGPLDRAVQPVQLVQPVQTSRKRPHDDDEPRSEETVASLLKGILLPQQRKDNADNGLRILELGSGVGILGIGLATILREAAATTTSAAYTNTTILLTDLPEAEERARANMALWEPAPLPTSGIHLAYANLDWEDGRRGTFDAAVVAPYSASPQPYDLVMLSDCTYNVDMLPALVETLGALQTATHQATQRVLLTKKTRHASEALLFTLMAEHGWRMLAGGGHAIRLPVLGGDDEQTIEVFLFERRRCVDSS